MDERKRRREERGDGEGNGANERGGKVNEMWKGCREGEEEGSEAENIG